MRRGLALVLVVGVLGVLAVLGSAFTILSRLERRAASQRVLATQASLLSRSGIEDALARLDMGQDADLDSNRYAGEDWDYSNRFMATMPLSAFEAPNEVYHLGTADMEACPVRHAMRPSFFVRIASGNPATVRVDGKLRGFSGRLASGTWSLKVLPQSGLFVNGGEPLDDPAAGYNAVLRRILGTLARSVDEELGGIDGSPVSRTDGLNLVNLRPRTSRGWESWEQVRDLAFGGSQAKLDVLKPYLALKAWVDRRVVVPNVDATMIDKTYHSLGDIRMGRPVGPDGTRAPGFERNAAGRNVGRAPVGLNWARKRKPVLLALISELKGLYLDETSYTVWGVGDWMGMLRPVEIVNAWSPADDAHTIAMLAHFMFPEIRTWPEWDAQVEALSLNIMDPTNFVRKDMLKACFNPNTDLTKTNPNLSLCRRLDKSDFLVYSTELTLAPVFAHEIESAGRVLGPGGRVLASRALRAETPVPSVARLSTQSDFVCGNLGSPDLPGDETGPRLPGADRYLTESQGLGQTWGHRQDVRGLLPAPDYATSWMDGSSMGVSLQTYPEPCYDATPNLNAVLPDPTPTGLEIRPALYDGSLQLASVETEDDDLYGVTATSQDMELLGRFTAGYDLDLADAYPANPAGKTCLTDLQLAVGAELGNGLFHATKPSSLLPDGILSEADRAPGYPTFNSMHGLHGVISMWSKPATYGGPLLTATHDTDAGAGGGSSANQFFMMTCTHLHFEISNATFDDNREHQFSGIQLAISPHRWRMSTCFYDFKSTTRDDTGRFYVDDGALGSSLNLYVTSTTNAQGAAKTLTLPDRLGAHFLTLGTRALRDYYFVNTMVTQGANSTLDEVAIYDFGGAVGGNPTPADALASASILAAARFKDGRYYKGSVYAPPGLYGVTDQAGSWISAPLALPGGSVLKRVAWTWYRPSELPTDYPEVELLDSFGDDWLWSEPRSRSTFGTRWSKDRQDWDASGRFDAPFRLRVTFRRQTPVGENTPILDSPVLDDLTLIYRPGGAPGLSAFRFQEGS